MILLNKQEYFFDVEGKFLIQFNYGNYGFIQHEKMKQLPLVLYDMGIERRYQEDYYYNNLLRPSYKGYLLQYTFNGYGVFKTNNKQYLLKEGMGFFCKMPDDSQYYLPDYSYPKEYRETGWEFFYLHFDGPAAKAFYDTFHDLTNSVFNLPVNEPAIRLFLRLFETCERNGSLALYEGSEFLYRFLAQLLRSLESPTLDKTGLICHAQTYIREYFQSIKNINEIAEFCNVSHEHLTRSFTKEIGQTPIQFLTKVRIEHALFLLLNTTDSVESIALSCGFQSGNYFAKVFRRFLHCSPEKYRKRNS